FLGTDATGTQAVANGNDGVLIKDAANNTVGGLTAGARNLISGNGFVGVAISDPGATGNVVQGNFIGTDVNGTAALGNNTGVNGVDITGVGGLIPAGNRVQGNFIGTDATGGAALPNHGDGVFIDGANTVGGTTAGAGNLIANNTGDGVAIHPLIDTHVAIL